MVESSIPISRGKENFRLTKKERFLYSLTNTPNYILGGIFTLLYVNFFWDNLGLNQAYFVGAQIFYGLVNCLNDFYFGGLSDKTNVKRWGSRRLIYIKWGGPLWALVFFLTWFPWSTTNQIVILVQYLVCMCTFDSLLSLVWIVWIALMSELTENIDERNRMGLNNSLFYVLAIIFVLIGFILFESGGSMLYFRIYSGICAIICAGLYYYIGSTLKERPELYVNQEKLPLFYSIKEVLKSRSYISMTLFRVFNQLNNSLSSAFLFVFVYWLGPSFSYIAMLIPIIAIIGSVIYRKLSEKIDVRTLVLVGRTLQIINNVIMFLILFIPGTDLLVWISIFLNGILGGFMIFDYPIMALVMDEDEVVHQQRREGLILGTNAFFNKMTESFAPILGTYVLLAFGFEKNTPIQTDQAILGIKILFLLVPAIVNLITLISFRFFPIYGKRLIHLQEDLHKIHLEKEKMYSETK